MLQLPHQRTAFYPESPLHQGECCHWATLGTIHRQGCSCSYRCAESYVLSAGRERMMQKEPSYFSFFVVCTFLFFIRSASFNFNSLICEKERQQTATVLFPSGSREGAKRGGRANSAALTANRRTRGRERWQEEREEEGLQRRKKRRDCVKSCEEGKIIWGMAEKRVGRQHMVRLDKRVAAGY